MDIERLWQFCFNTILYHGFAGAELRALSAVEIALWDIMGKSAGRAGLSPIRRRGPPGRQHVQHLYWSHGPWTTIAAGNTDAGALGG